MAKTSRTAYTSVRPIELDSQSTKWTTSLSVASTHNNFDPISNGSPRRSDYLFSGDFAFNFNSDIDGSFPSIDGAKSEPLFDNQALVEINSFEAVSSSGQLTPVTIESRQNDEIKNSSKDVKPGSPELVSLSDDDVLSAVLAPHSSQDHHHLLRRDLSNAECGAERIFSQLAKHFN